MFVKIGPPTYDQGMIACRDHVIDHVIDHVMYIIIIRIVVNYVNQTVYYQLNTIH